MISIHSNISLSDRHTFRLPATTCAWADIPNEAALQDFRKQEVVQSFIQQNLIMPLGSGSNVLFLNDYPGLILHSSDQNIRWIAEDANSLSVVVGAGMNWDVLVDLTLQKGGFGLENLSSIPGTVGAAPIQNIGAYGVEIKESIKFVRWMDLLTGEVFNFSTNECEFSYRDSFFKRRKTPFYIVEVGFKLSKHFQPKLSYPDLASRVNTLESVALVVTAYWVRTQVLDIRRLKLPDPTALPNAGSFFKNPIVDKECFQNWQKKIPSIKAFELSDGSYKVAAGWMLEFLGWKGRRSLTVGMHDQQALVLINHNDAKATDVEKWIHAIQSDVKRVFNCYLEIEPLLIK